MTYSGKKQPVPSGKPPPLKRKKSRLILKLAMVLAGLFALFLILFLSLDLNTFRVPVEKAIYQATGTKIEFDFIEWDFSKTLQLKCEGVRILPDVSQERPGAAFTTKELLIDIELLPLLQRQVVLESITAIGPVLKFSIEASPKKETLPQSEKSSSELIPDPSPSMETKPSSPAGFTEWLQKIREFLRESENLTLDEINLVAAQVILQDEETGKEAVLSGGARMEINRKKNQVGFAIDDIELAMGNIRVQGEIRMEDILPPNALLQANLNIEPFNVSDLIQGLEWVPDSRGIIKEQIMLKGNIQKIKLQIETPVDTITDTEVIIKFAKADLILKAQEVSLVQFGKTLSAQSLDVAFQWRDQQLTHKIVLAAMGGIFETEGKTFREKDSKNAQDWTVDSHVTLEEINMVELKNISPQQVAWFPEKGTLAGKVHVQGPVLRPEMMKGKGNFKVTNLVVKVKDAPVVIPVTEFEGKLDNGQLVHDLKLEIFGGNLKVRGQLTMNKNRKGEWDPVIDSDILPQSVQLTSLRLLVQKEWFPEKGTLAGKVHVQGPVLRPEMMKGKGDFKVTNLVVKVKDAPVVIPVTEFEGKLDNGQLVHDLKLEIFGGNLQVKGNLKLNKTRKGEWDPVIDFDVIPQSLQLASLPPLAQKDLLPKQGTLTGKLHLQGPVMRPETMKSKGNLNVLNLEVNVNNTPVPIPKIEINGTWADNHLVHDLKMKVFDADMQVKGQLHFAKDRQGDRDPVIESKVFIKPISLTRLKPLVAQTWFPDKGVMDGTIQVRGPILRSQAIKAQGNLRVRNTAISFEGQAIDLAEIVGEGLWSKNRLSHHIKTKVFDGEVSIQGDLNFIKNNQGELDPMIDSEVIPKSIQLASLRTVVQKDGFPEAGMLTGSVHLKGPVKRFSEVALTGHLAGNKVILNIQEKPVAFEKAFLSFKPDTRNNIQIGFNLSHISIGDFSLQKSTGNMVYSKKTVELTQGKIWPKTGQVLLKGDYKFETKDYKLNFSGNGLRWEDYKSEFLEGPLGFKGNLFGSIVPEGFKKGLSANIAIHSENGKLLKAGKILTKILNALNMKIFRGVEKGLPIDFLGGDCTIKDGILTTENFRMVSPSLKLRVTGRADLTDEKIDAEAIAIPLQMVDKVFASLNQLMAKSQATSGNRGLLSKTIKEIPIIGSELVGKDDENKKGLLDGILKMIPLLGDKRKEDEQPEGLVKVYFSIHGTFQKPSVYYLPEKTFIFK